jgi:hypothetical protein
MTGFEFVDVRRQSINFESKVFCGGFLFLTWIQYNKSMRFCSPLFRQLSFFVALTTLLVQGTFLLSSEVWAGEVENFDLKSSDNNLQVIIQTDKRAQYSVEHGPKGMSVLLNDANVPSGTPRTKTFTLSNGKRVQGTLSNTANGQVRLHIPEVTAKDFAVSVVQKTIPKTTASAPREEGVPSVTSAPPKPRTSAFQQTGGQNEADLLDAIVKRFQGETPHTDNTANGAARNPTAKPVAKTLSKPDLKPSVVKSATVSKPEANTKKDNNKQDYKKQEPKKETLAVTKPFTKAQNTKKQKTKPVLTEPVAALAVGGPEVQAPLRQGASVSKSSLSQELSRVGKTETTQTTDLAKPALFAAGTAAAPPVDTKKKPAEPVSEGSTTTQIGPETTVAESTTEVKPSEPSQAETLSQELDSANPTFDNSTFNETASESLPLTVVETGTPTEPQRSIWEEWIHWNAMLLSDLPSWAIGVMGVFLLLMGVVGGTVAIRALLRQLNQQMDADAKLLPLDLIPMQPSSRSYPQDPLVAYAATGSSGSRSTDVPDSDLDFGLNAVQTSFSTQAKPFQDRARVNASQYLMGNHRDMRQAVRTTMRLKYATKPPTLFK